MEQIEEYQGYRIAISQDDCSENPRDWDNLGVIVAEHKRYTIGEEYSIRDVIFSLAKKYLLKDRNKLMPALKIICESKSLSYLVNSIQKSNSGDVKDFIFDYLYDSEDYSILFDVLDLIDEVYYLPVYMYDHSGISLSTGKFSCIWDSGQIGFIYVEKEKLVREGLEDKTDNEVFEYLKQEVETYSQYLEGNVYSFNILDSDGECVDSCGGFYGYDYCLSQAKEIIKHLKN